MLDARHDCIFSIFNLFNNIIILENHFEQMKVILLLRGPTTKPLYKDGVEISIFQGYLVVYKSQVSRVRLPVQQQCSL